MRKLLAATVIVLALAACWKSESLKSEKLSIADADGTKAEYKVELAQTEKEMSKGLMFRESLKNNAGMLFALWKVGEESAMWMKNTKISLDMLFIDKDGMIYWIYENAEPNSTKLIIPPYPAYAVLEINGGETQKHGIKLGDVVKCSWFETAAVAEDQPVVEAEAVEAPVEETVEKVADEAEKPAPKSLD